MKTVFPCLGGCGQSAQRFTGLVPLKGDVSETKEPTELEPFSLSLELVA